MPNEAIFEIDQDMAKEFISEVVKNQTSGFFKMLFNATTRLSFNDGFVEIKVAFFRYYLKPLYLPYNLTGTYTIEHNLPLDKINKNSLPDNIKIDPDKIYFYIPKSPITEAIVLKEVKIENDRIFVKVGL